MNTVLLRAARRHSNGTRFWIIPGMGNATKLSPARHSIWNAPSFSWPCTDNRGEMIRSVRLDWHRAIAKAEARKLIAAYEVAQ